MESSLSQLNTLSSLFKFLSKKLSSFFLKIKISKLWSQIFCKDITNNCNVKHEYSCLGDNSHADQNKLELVQKTCNTI